MKLYVWAVPLVVSGVWSFLIWHYKARIGAYLAKSVEHKFDARLAQLQSELRDKEANVQAELRAKEKQLEQLRAGALSALSTRQSALDKRRLEAVDQLWQAFHMLTPARTASYWMTMIKVDAFEKVIKENDQMKDLLKAISAPDETLKSALDTAERARPFVSKLAWAYFVAYRAIVTYAFAQVAILKAGLSVKGFKDDTIIELVKQALPEYSEYLDQHGTAGAYQLLEKLETRLLDELKEGLEGSAQDKVHVDLAARILAATSQVESATQRQSVPYRQTSHV